MIEVFDCEQGSPEWFECRRGIPTASEFGTILAKGRDGGASKTRRTYLLKLLGERVTGDPMYSYSNEHMERGKEMEAEARNMYAFLTDESPKQVGFLRSGDKGASPDSLIDANGLLEIKTKLAHLQMEVLLAGEVPAEHIPQLQGQLWVAEREWVDFVSYWPNAPLYVKRVYRDEAYIRDLAKAVDQFNHELATMEGVIDDQKMHLLLRLSIRKSAREVTS